MTQDKVTVTKAFDAWRKSVFCTYPDKVLLAAFEAGFAAAEAEARKREEALAAHVKALVQLAIDGGLTHDLVAQLFPDAKKPNGQPADEFAKRAHREINEAKAALAAHHAEGEGK